jgi:hypothetical protein
MAALHRAWGRPPPRPIVGARYDAENKCFHAPAAIADYCAVPTYCLGGGGQVICVIDASGHAELSFVFYGEEMTRAALHHEGTTAQWEDTLTAEETQLCAAMYSAYAHIVDAATGELFDDSALAAESSVVQVSPHCD